MFIPLELLSIIALNVVLGIYGVVPLIGAISVT